MLPSLFQIDKSASITDWIGACGTLLGVPIACWAIVKLFLKDKDKERQLSALEEVAITQKDLNVKIQLELEQLIVQTGEFQHQTNLMIDHNEILRSQVELQGKALIANEKYQQAGQALEQQIRRSAIKPDFVIGSTGSSQGNYSLTLKNSGQMANDFTVISGNSQNLSIQVERNELRTNVSTTLTIGNFHNLNFMEIAFKLKVSFKDEDGNQYEQNVIVQAGKAAIDRPALVTELAGN